MRLLIASALVLTACGEDEEEQPAAQSTPEAASCDKASLQLRTDGVLTVGTDKPAYPPYFIDDDPTNGKGFESAVAYAIADQLGFTKDEVEWTVVPFNASYRPGPKDFDFDVNQISITPQRASASTSPSRTTRPRRRSSPPRTRRPTARRASRTSRPSSSACRSAPRASTR